VIAAEIEVVSPDFGHLEPIIIAPVANSKPWGSRSSITADHALDHPARFISAALLCLHHLRTSEAPRGTQRRLGCAALVFTASGDRVSQEPSA
jgi:hypothetical protein